MIGTWSTDASNKRDAEKVLEIVSWLPYRRPLRVQSNSGCRRLERLVCHEHVTGIYRTCFLPRIQIDIDRSKRRRERRFGQDLARRTDHPASASAGAGAVHPVG